MRYIYTCTSTTEVLIFRDYINQQNLRLGMICFGWLRLFELERFSAWRFCRDVLVYNRRRLNYAFTNRPPQDGAPIGDTDLGANLVEQRG